MSDMKCPYCEAEQEACQDDIDLTDDSERHAHECTECGKNFVFRVYVAISYEPAKADCLNDGNHKWFPSNTWPQCHTRMLCRTCDASRKPTDEEKITHGIPPIPPTQRVQL